MVPKQKKHRAKCVLVGAAVLLIAVPRPVPAFAAAAQEAQESIAGQEDAGPAEEMKLKIMADTSGVGSGDRKFKTTITFESYNDSDTGFNSLTESIMVGDTKFVLSSIDGLKMTDSRTPARRTMEFTTDTFVKGKENEFLPEESVKKDGVSWTLTDKELIDSEIPDRVKDAVASKRYVGVEKGVPIPDTMEYTYTDGDTGESVSEMLPLTGQSESAWYWTPFEFPITVSGYGAEFLDLNGTEVSANARLTDYSGEFLDMLGLSRDYYRIDSVEWDGEPYERGGETCRNAVGTGEKYVTDIDAVYSGTVPLPHRDGAAWQCLYMEELDDSRRAVYTYTAEAVYVSTAGQTPFGRILGVISAFYQSVIEAVMEHPFLAATQLVALAALITFLVSRRKKKCLYDSSRKCAYNRDCANCPYYTTLSRDGEL